MLIWTAPLSHLDSHFLLHHELRPISPKVLSFIHTFEIKALLTLPVFLATVYFSKLYIEDFSKYTLFLIIFLGVGVYHTRKLLLLSL